MAEDTITRQMVIDYVQPSPRKWENPKGSDLYFVSVNFSDGTEGSVGVVENKVDEAMGSLTALKGVPTEFELKAGKEYNGVQQYRLYTWPGKPDGLGGSGGGGGRGGGGMSHSQAGYMAAASALSGVFTQTPNLPAATMAARIIELGETLTEALFSRKPKDQAPTTAAPSSDARTASDTLTLTQLKALKETIEAAGMTVEDAQKSLGVSHLTQLTPAQAEEAIELFRA